MSLSIVGYKRLPFNVGYSLTPRSQREATWQTALWRGHGERTEAAAKSHMSKLESSTSSPSLQGLLSWLTTWLQLHKRTNQEIVWDDNSYCLTLLSFGVICYAARDNLYTALGENKPKTEYQWLWGTALPFRTAQGRKRRLTEPAFCWFLLCPLWELVHAQ